MSQNNDTGNDSSQVGTHEGCLIDPDRLKEGDRLFSVVYGWSLVLDISEDTSPRPVSMMSQDGDKRIFYMTKDGRDATWHKMPTVFTENPYEFAIRQMKRDRNLNLNLTAQNQELWQENLRLKGEIHHLQAYIKKMEDA